MSLTKASGTTYGKKVPVNECGSTCRSVSILLLPESEINISSAILVLKMDSP